MPLSVGDQLGPYDVIAAIGAGGMGEVYKARDTRLDRTVAIKVLPEHIAKRDDLRARFEREARAVASLNHPNICTLYDIGNQEGVGGFMVMELIEGESLAARIEKGAIPLDQSLKLATQIADALDRAHRAGVTHRDVKPQNIMLTRDGVKVLDFGLAKSQAKPGPTEETLTKVLTTEGTIMGTPQYMAPEQFAGKEADARSDIWAFGAVLYEMVTGQKAFHGSNYQSLVGAILAMDPAPMASTPFTPSWLERLVRRCLQKDPEDRYLAMHDIVLDLKSPPVEAAAEPARRTPWPWIAACAVTTLLAAWLAFAHLGEKPEPAPLIRTALVFPPNIHHDETSIAVSPDEKRVALIARDAEGNLQLWVRPLAATTATPLAGTVGAANPFWSPDGKSIAFFVDKQLKRIDASGGPVLTIADLPRGGSRGASWSSTGEILYAPPNGPLKKVSASGGPVTDATKLTGQDFVHRRPWFLPDARHFVFAAGDGNSLAPKTIRLGSLDSAETTKLIDAADSGSVYSGGYLLFLRRQVLMAQPFDARKLATTGDALPVVEDIPGGGVPTEAGFSASANGLLVHASGSQVSDLTWFNRKGDRIATLGEPADFESLSFSADRTRAAVTIRDQQRNPSVWLVDAARGLRTPISPGRSPGFSADGRLVFYSFPQPSRGGVTLEERGRVFRSRADVAGASEIVAESPTLYPYLSSSPDGKFLLLNGNGRLLVLPDPAGEPGKSKPYPFLSVESRMRSAAFSPDGRWIAFHSSETGRSEVFVTPFPGPGVRRQISTAGGSDPRWRGDGREIFFVGRDGRIAAAEVAPRNGTIETGEVRVLFDPRMASGLWPAYDVSADGQRILAIVPRGTSDGLTVVQNWPALLKK